LDYLKIGPKFLPKRR